MRVRVGVRVGADYWLYTEPLSCDSLRARYLHLLPTTNNLVTAHRALELRLAEESEEADHGEAAVVDLGDQALGLLLGRLVLGDLEGVEQVERHRVRQLVERREVARLAW